MTVNWTMMDDGSDRGLCEKMREVSLVEKNLCFPRATKFLKEKHSVVLSFLLLFFLYRSSRLLTIQRGVNTLDRVFS